MSHLMDFEYEILIADGEGNIHRMSTNSFYSANFWFFQYKEQWSSCSIGLYRKNVLLKRYHPWCGIKNIIQKREDDEENPSQIDCADKA